MHMLLDLRGPIPSFIHVSDGTMGMLPSDDEPGEDPSGARGGQQMIRALLSQPVGRGESPIEIAQIDLLDGSELVNHDFRLLLSHRALRLDFDGGLGGEAEETALFLPVMRQVFAQSQQPARRPLPAMASLVGIVESPGGVSPPGAPRTVREPLDSHGSRCSAVAMT
jgi:hypothetical protein